MAESMKCIGKVDPTPTRAHANTYQTSKGPTNVQSHKITRTPGHPSFHDTSDTGEGRKNEHAEHTEQPKTATVPF